MHHSSPDRAPCPACPTISPLYPAAADIQRFWRADPATDRALTVASECRTLASTILEKLRPCEPLLQVARSTESCTTLINIFGLLNPLLSQPSHIYHICAPPGLCPQEAWHTRHAGKVEELTRRLQRFLDDFQSPAVPRSTDAFAAKIERHATHFQHLQAGIQRSWLRLEHLAAEAEMERYVLEILEIQKRLAALNHGYRMLQMRRTELRGQFDATPGHP
ncbi:hypothetical protein C8R44DRAFT_783035 [Mycena epipterygia]|nr:hypothetical protein C8R44DRAFT_783035 [Mycena epipterygia]